jgi:hypothetical protein
MTRFALGLQRFIDLLPWHIASRIRQHFPPLLRFCFVLNEDPPIVLVPEDFYDDSAASWDPFFEAMRDCNVTFVCLVRWAAEGNPGYRTRLPRVVADHIARHPSHRFVYLANNKIQLNLFNEIGMRTVFVNQNALTDERPFTVQESAVKRYDAIYNAVMAPFKRHELAADVKKLALITYFTPDSESYFERTRELLAGATWLNFAGRPPEKENYTMIPQSGLARYLNEARTGLCLSAKEGAMFASIEYLLCGLSIVTTPSIGGRDVFFDPDYVETVEADPAAVSEGVRRICGRAVPPSHIRTNTLRVMEEHRQRFLAFIEQLVIEAGRRFDIAEARRRIFPNPLYKLREVHRIATVVRRFGHARNAPPEPLVGTNQ